MDQPSLVLDPTGAVTAISAAARIAAETAPNATAAGAKKGGAVPTAWDTALHALGAAHRGWIADADGHRAALSAAHTTAATASVGDVQVQDAVSAMAFPAAGGNAESC